MKVRFKLSADKRPWNRLRDRILKPGEEQSGLSLASNTRLPEAGSSLRELQEITAEEAQIEPESRLVYETDPRGLAAHRIRFLRMVLRECWKTGKLKRLLVTSPLPSDGKSTISLNLATSLAERGKRKVVLVEADLYRPSLSHKLGITPRAGLAECLEKGLEPLSVTRRINPLEWYLLPAGIIDTDTTESLHSQAFSDLMRELSARFDWVVVDSPPMLPVSDAVTLGRQTDASLLVVRAGSTPSEAIQQAIGLLGEKHVLSVVLNGAEGLDRHYEKSTGYYGNQNALLLR